ncbi:MAG: hypothetical protein ACRBG0_28515, partial [Lewinella sp.]
MKYILLLSFFVLLITSFISAQYPDNNWVLGKSSEIVPLDSFGLVVLNFSGNQLKASEELDVVYIFRANNSVISDNDSLLFYFNGLDIHNSDHEILTNGENMYIGQSSSGYVSAQSSLVLPWPEHEDNYYLLTSFNGYDEETNFSGGLALHYSIIYINANNTSEGTVIVKNELLLDQLFLDRGRLTATRHANGRDWWILWKYYDENTYIRYLLDPQGLHRYDDQTIGEPFPTGVGQTVFSPDGSKYVIFNSIGPTEGKYVSIYDFDRCSGLLSNQTLITFPHNGFGGGVSISPNSRYLYVSSTLVIYQFDLWAEDIEASRVTIVESDGTDPNQGYYLAQLARDGKIYISGYGLSKALNVIEYPDRPGFAATVTTLELPVYNAFSIPNIPNHRLGPLDGRDCDTLGINNFPLA